jgi:hypothetical protein
MKIIFFCIIISFVFIFYKLYREIIFIKRIEKFKNEEYK